MRKISAVFNSMNPFYILICSIALITLLAFLPFVKPISTVVPIVIVSFISSFMLFFIPKNTMSPRKILWFILLIIFQGTLVRLFLAYVCPGNYDAESWQLVADIASRGGNVYAETYRYNYSPVWFLVLSGLKYLNAFFASFPFHFMVRGIFLTSVDLATLGILLLIAKKHAISLVKTAIFFYLNPVSIVLTGYHGQFENFSILMLLTGIALYFYYAHKEFLSKCFLFAFSTSALIIKHTVFSQVLICLNFISKRWWVRVMLFSFSVILFFATFAPYWHEGSTGIINNAFRYGSLRRPYGLEPLFYFPRLKYVFIIGMFLYPFFLKTKDIIKQSLLGMLFFLVFTTGVSIQYFILPIALGALRPSKGFIMYTIVTALFIIGADENLAIPFFNFFHWNIVWSGAVFWFLTEHYDIQFKKGASFPYVTQEL